ncbi:MAG: hypothetical protein LBW85_02840, partial [Deltaproteobacteria bacterium]|nr:hypothetical protein [Deltaproteobacteria bacterium]
MTELVGLVRGYLPFILGVAGLLALLVIYGRIKAKGSRNPSLSQQAADEARKAKWAAIDASQAQQGPGAAAPPPAGAASPKPGKARAKEEAAAKKAAEAARKAAEKAEAKASEAEKAARKKADKEAAKLAAQEAAKEAARRKQLLKAAKKSGAPLPEALSADDPSLGPVGGLPPLTAPPQEGNPYWEGAPPPSGAFAGFAEAPAPAFPPGPPSAPETVFPAPGSAAAFAAAAAAAPPPPPAAPP